MSVKINESIANTQTPEECCDIKLDNVLDNGYMFVGQGSAWEQIGQDIDGETFQDMLGLSIAINHNGYNVSVLSSRNLGAGSFDGTIKLYQYDGASWNQVGPDIENLEIEEGATINNAIDGQGFRVTANEPLYGPSSGRVTVYDWDGASWIQVGQSLLGTFGEGRFGISSELNNSGDILAVSELHNKAIGRTRVYELSGGIWNQLGTFIEGDNNWDGFYRISLDDVGHRIIIGGPDNLAPVITAGYARVYDWDGISWNQVGQTMVGQNVGDGFGSSVEISGDGTTVAIGSPFNPGSQTSAGSVSVYEYNSGSGQWDQVGSNIDGSQDNSLFGTTVSINNDGSRVIVGSTLYDSVVGTDSGLIQVFEWDGVQWMQVGSQIAGEDLSDEFGVSVDMNNDGSIIGAGAALNDEEGTDAGHARMFEYSGDAMAIGVPVSGDVSITNAGITTVSSASESEAGKVEFADVSETESGISNTLAITPEGGEATYFKNSNITNSSLLSDIQTLGATFSKTNNDASEDTWIYTGLNMTITKAGTHEVFIRPTGRIYPLVAPLTEPLPLMFRLYDVTNASEVSECKVTVVCYSESSDVSISGFVNAGYSKAIVTTTGSTIYHLEMLYSSSLAGVTYDVTSVVSGDNEGQSRTFIGYRQLMDDSLDNQNDYTGSTSSQPGREGKVHVPQINDQFGALSGNGDWTTKFGESLAIPSGITSERPSSPIAGMIRFNFDTSSLEGYDGTSWVTFTFV